MMNQSVQPQDPSAPPIPSPHGAAIATDIVFSPGAARERPAQSSGLDQSSDESDSGPDPESVTIFTHPYKCEGECGGLRYKRYSSFKRHTSGCVLGKRYACPNCDKLFNHSQHMRRHRDKVSACEILTRGPKPKTNVDHQYTIGSVKLQKDYKSKSVGMKAMTVANRQFILKNKANPAVQTIIDHDQKAKARARESFRRKTKQGGSGSTATVDDVVMGEHDSDVDDTENSIGVLCSTATCSTPETTRSTPKASSLSVFDSKPSRKSPRATTKKRTWSPSKSERQRRSSNRLHAANTMTHANKALPLRVVANLLSVGAKVKGIIAPTKRRVESSVTPATSHSSLLDLAENDVDVRTQLISTNANRSSTTTTNNVITPGGQSTATEIPMITRIPGVVSRADLRKHAAEKAKAALKIAAAKKAAAMLNIKQALIIECPDTRPEDGAMEVNEAPAPVDLLMSVEGTVPVPSEQLFISSAHPPQSSLSSDHQPVKRASCEAGPEEREGDITNRSAMDELTASGFHKHFPVECDDVSYDHNEMTVDETVIVIRANQLIQQKNFEFGYRMSAAGVELNMGDAWLGDAIRKSDRIKNPEWNKGFVERNYAEWHRAILRSNKPPPCIEKRMVTGSDAGYGVFATKDIQASQPCSKYGGDMYGTESGVETMESCLDEIGEGNKAVYTMQVEGMHRNKRRKFWLDGRKEETYLGPCINHSKTGNVRPYVLYDNDTPLVIFIARKYIPKGAELNYNYNIRDRDYEISFPWYSA